MTRVIVRTVVIVLTAVVSVYVVYLLRKPISWVVIAGFLAVAMAGPVNFLNRYMKRGLAIATVYLGLFATVVLLGLLLIPPVVSEINDLADNAPRYAQDVRDYVNKNESLRKLEEDYDITTKLQDEAEKLFREALRITVSRGDRVFPANLIASGEWAPVEFELCNCREEYRLDAAHVSQLWERPELPGQDPAHARRPAARRRARGDQRGRTSRGDRSAVRRV